MKQNIIELLKFITEQGYDNSQWGICDFEVETDCYFNTLSKKKIANFIFVYCKSCDESAANFLKNNSPDYILIVKGTAGENLYIFNY